MIWHKYLLHIVRQHYQKECDNVEGTVLCNVASLGLAKCILQYNNAYLIKNHI